MRTPPLNLRWHRVDDTGWERCLGNRRHVVHIRGCLSICGFNSQTCVNSLEIRNDGSTEATFTHVALCQHIPFPRCWIPHQIQRNQSVRIQNPASTHTHGRKTCEICAVICTWHGIQAGGCQITGLHVCCAVYCMTWRPCTMCVCVHCALYNGMCCSVPPMIRPGQPGGKKGPCGFM